MQFILQLQLYPQSTRHKTP